MSSLDKQEHNLSVFLDLSKAFDIIDHTILINKLNHYGVRGVALHCFRSYLSNRKQFEISKILNLIYVTLFVVYHRVLCLGPLFIPMTYPKLFNIQNAYSLRMIRLCFYCTKHRNKLDNIYAYKCTIRKNLRSKLIPMY